MFNGSLKIDTKNKLIMLSLGDESTGYGTRPPQFPVNVKSYIDEKFHMDHIVNNNEECTLLIQEYGNTSWGTAPHSETAFVVCGEPQPIRGDVSSWCAATRTI